MTNYTCKFNWSSKLCRDTLSVLDADNIFTFEMVNEFLYCNLDYFRIIWTIKERCVLINDVSKVVAEWNEKKYD